MEDIWFSILSMSNVCVFSCVSKYFNTVAYNVKCLLYKEFKTTNYITDNVLLCMDFIQNLDLTCNDKITDMGMFNLTRLTDLTLNFQTLISNDGIMNLPFPRKLTTLNLCSNRLITDDGLKILTNLTSLNLSFNSKISGEGLIHLPKLLHLDVSFGTHNIFCIKSLTNLTHLDLHNNHVITDCDIRNLKNLKYLNISYNSTITNYGIYDLTNLTYLNLVFNKKVSSVKSLINLQFLILYHGSYIKDINPNTIVSIDR